RPKRPVGAGEQDRRASQRRLEMGLARSRGAAEVAIGHEAGREATIGRDLLAPFPRQIGSDRALLVITGVPYPCANTELADCRWRGDKVRRPSYRVGPVKCRSRALQHLN